MSIFKKLIISCSQATSLHEKKAAGQADSMEKLGLWVHLLYCRFCRLFIKQSEQLTRAVKQLGKKPTQPAPDPQFKTQLHQKFDTFLKNTEGL